jgi:hypothetical protein
MGREEVGQTMRTVALRRLATVRQWIDHAVEHGHLSSVHAYFCTELLSGPVHLHVDRGYRRFTRAEAEKPVDIALAGIRATA